jgi:protease-4
VKRLVASVALVVWASGCVLLAGNQLSFLQRDRRLEETTIEGEGRAKVLLIEIAEVITDSPTKHAFGIVEEESTLGRVQAELDRAGDDSRVAAVVLRINTPGGGTTASDEIFTELRRFKEKHDVPVIASLGDMATSGGYYVACAADRIIAQPTTLTGSIGVILMGLNVEGLLGKIGVRNQTYKAGEHKDILSPFRAATPEEKRIVQTILDRLHARFVTIVRESRPRLEQRRIPELTDGRVLDAADAQAAGLVDQIGDLHDAIEAAKEAAHVARARVIRYHHVDESRDTLYAQGHATPAQVNILPIDLGVLAGTGARFMYLWAPGLSD